MLFVGLILAYTFVPLMALHGLIWSLTGTKKGRASAIASGILGLIAQIASVLLLILTAGGNLANIEFDLVIRLFQVGFYTTLAGFLWMAITPSFAPKSK
jgi:hypothetical protein